MPKLVAYLLALSSVATPLAAQVESPGSPASTRFALAAEPPVVTLPRPDVERYLAEDVALREARGPLRYGAVVAERVDLDERGTWELVEATGAFVGRLELASPGARSLGVLFAEFDLPAGGELYLYAPDGSDVLGALTEANEQPNGMLATRPVLGDRVVLEYVQPASVSGTPRLVVESVVHDYRGVLDPTGSDADGLDAPCLIDVNCPAGDPYQDVKRSIVALFAGGFTCSGAILNNTANDGTPYLLTADHCGDFTNGVFLFNYERPGCNTGIAPTVDSVSGAQLVQTDGYIDATLWLLNQAPPPEYAPFYAGWGRGTRPKAPAPGISHPNGLPKKIHVEGDDPQEAGGQWLVNWDQGEIQWGSSGSPLFNQRKRVLGPLSTTFGDCANQQSGYGQFHRFWNRRNLAPYLDPAGLGLTGIDGYDPNAIRYNGSAVNPDVWASLVPPRIGATWIGEVDASSYPSAVSTLVRAHAAGTSGLVFPWGELLIDVGTSRLFQSTAPVVSGLSRHVRPVPNEPALVGLWLFSQAILLGGGLQATNGVELRVL